MQIAIIIHSIHLGPNSYNESETIAKYEIMDGAPVRGLCTEQHFLCVCLIPPSHFLLFILVFLSPPPAFTIFWLSITPLHPTIFMFLPLYHPLQLNFSILLHHTRHPPLPQPSPCFIPHPSSTIPSYPHNLNFSPPFVLPTPPFHPQSPSTTPILSLSIPCPTSYSYLTPSILPPSCPPPSFYPSNPPFHPQSPSTTPILSLSIPCPTILHPLSYPNPARPFILSFQPFDAIPPFHPSHISPSISFSHPTSCSSTRLCSNLITP